MQHVTALRDDPGRFAAARDAFLAVLARDPSHAGALAGLGALLLGEGYTSAAHTVFAQGAAAHPDEPSMHVNLANLLRQCGRLEEARAAYEAALRLDPACPEAHQGLAYLLDLVDAPKAARHRKCGFANRVLTTGTYRGDGKPVTVLQIVSSHGGNIPTARILDDRICLTHTLVAEFADPREKLPPHDVVFNAIGDADRCACGLAAAARLLGGHTRPVINAPEKILPTTRAGVALRLASIPGVIVPRIALCTRAMLAAGPPDGFAPPFLLRSPGFHTGQHFCRVDTAADLAAAMAALPGDRLMALEYLDAAGHDGAARKYRVMFIGGEIMPLHLAISADWKVHYYTAGMRDNAAHRAEEERFLSGMASVLGPVAMQALGAIESALGLDYGGADFALAPDGRLMLFEANATMILAPPPVDAIWDYRRGSIDDAIARARGLVQEKVVHS
jgi:hypothetical protein